MLNQSQIMDTQRHPGEKNKLEEATSYEPRVVRHVNASGVESFAIHEVYFNVQHEVLAITTEALSSRENTGEALEDALYSLLETGAESFTTGDLGYEYESERVEDWTSAFDLPVLDNLSK